MLVDVLRDVCSAAKLLGLCIQRAHRRSDLVQQLRSSDAVGPDLRHHLVGSSDVVVEDPTTEDRQDEHNEYADGDVQIALLVLLALPL